jgi:hypothetical protein
MRALGCLGLLAMLGFLTLEGWFFWLVSGWINPLLRGGEVGHDVLTALIVIIILMFVGWRFAAWHIRQIPLSFLSGKAGRHFVGALGGVLLVVPGFLTDALGLVLLLPPVQLALSALGNRLLGSVVRVAMQRMMGGKMPGGFPGAFAGGFPGGFPAGLPKGFPAPGGLKPDEAFRFPGMAPRTGPKTYDTTAEK